MSYLKLSGQVEIPLNHPPGTFSPTGGEGRDEGVRFMGSFHMEPRGHKPVVQVGRFSPLGAVCPLPRRSARGVMRPTFMERRLRSILSGFAWVMIVATLYAQDVSEKKPTDLARHKQLQNVVDEAARKTLEKFTDKNLQTNQLAVTLIDLHVSAHPVQASFRGNVQIYPASVVKLFYLAAVHRWIEDGRLKETDEIRRAMRDMIVDSGNEPTHYLVDLLTGTTSGPELPVVELEEWYYKRNAVNRYFASLGYTNINVNRKPWGEGPYGRESQSVKAHAPNHRNWLTTDATARLMAEIVTGQAVSAKRAAAMMQLMERNPFSTKASGTGQARGFTGLALSPGDKLCSFTCICTSRG